MKQIPLSKGKFAIVDDEDFEYLSQWKWKYHKDNYAVRTTKEGNIYMHRLVNKTPKGCLTDHINRNGLDNRKNNLRITTHSFNCLNTGVWKHNTSGFKGVVWSKQKNKWVARVMLNDREIHLGFFSDVKKAGLARKQWEIQHAI